MTDTEKLEHALRALRDMTADMRILAHAFHFYVPASTYYAEAILEDHDEPWCEGKRRVAVIAEARKIEEGLKKP